MQRGVEGGCDQTEAATTDSRAISQRPSSGMRFEVTDTLSCDDRKNGGDATKSVNVAVNTRRSFLLPNVCRDTDGGGGGKGGGAVERI